MTPLPIDHKITGKRATFTIGDGVLTALHCPGHSPGSMVLLTELENQKILFGQDIHGPLHSDLLSDRRQYLESLAFIMNLGADILCEGHFGVYRGKSQVKQFIAGYLMAE